MYKYKTNTNRGLVKLIIIIIIGIVILSYFGFNIREIVEDPTTQNNITYVWGLTVSVWENYLRDPVLYVWQNVFIDLIWDLFLSSLENIGDNPQDLPAVETAE